MLEKLKNNFLNILLFLLIFYFIFNLLGGKRGLISYNINKKTFQNLEIQEKTLKKKILDIEQKNSLLTENIDVDFIEILIRDKFLYGKNEEKIYIINHNETSSSRKN
tara:strand:+ start:956 stop:1276 length:321 start_codon:yes stop_codon:yes gene_type:complete